MTRKRLLYGVIGWSALTLVLLYGALALAVSSPVDWRQVLTTVMMLGPLGSYLAAFAEWLPG